MRHSSDCLPGSLWRYSNSRNRPIDMIIERFTGTAVARRRSAIASSANSTRAHVVAGQLTGDPGTARHEAYQPYPDDGRVDFTDQTVHDSEVRTPHRRAQPSSCHDGRR